MSKAKGQSEGGKSLDAVALKVELDRVKQRNKDLESDIHQLKLIEEELIKDRDEAYSRSRTLEREKYEASREAEEWREHSKDLEQRCQSTEASLAELERRALEFSRKNAALSSEVATLRETTNNRIKELENEVEKAEARGRAAAAAALAPQHSSLMNSKTTLEHDVASIQSSLQTANLEVEMLRKTLDSCRQEKQEKVEQLLKTDTELQQWREKALVAESQLTALKASANSASQSKQTAEEVAQRLRERVAAAEATQRHNEATIKELKDQLEKERNEHRTTAKTLADTEGKLSKLAIAIDKATADSEQSRALAASVLSEKKEAVRREVEKEQSAWLAKQEQEREKAVAEALALAKEVHTREINRLRQELALKQEQMQADLDTMRRRAAILVRQVTAQYNQEVNEARKEGIDAVRRIAELHARELEDEATQRESMMASVRIEAFRSASALREDLLGQVSVYRQAACFLKLEAVAARWQQRRLQQVFGEWSRRAIFHRGKLSGRLRACLHQVRRHRRIRRLCRVIREWRAVTAASRLGTRGGKGWKSGTASLVEELDALAGMTGTGSGAKPKKHPKASMAGVKLMDEEQYIPSAAVAAATREPAKHVPAALPSKARGGVMRFQTQPVNGKTPAASEPSEPLRLGFGGLPVAGDAAHIQRVLEAWTAGYAPSRSIPIMQTTLQGEPVRVERPEPLTVTPMLAIVFAGLAASRRRALAVSQVFDEIAAAQQPTHPRTKDDSALLRVVGNSWGKVVEVHSLLEKMLNEPGGAPAGEDATTGSVGLPSPQKPSTITTLVRDRYQQRKYSNPSRGSPRSSFDGTEPTNGPSDMEAPAQDSRDLTENGDSNVAAVAVEPRSRSGSSTSGTGSPKAPTVIRLLPWDLSAMLQLAPSSAEALFGTPDGYTFITGSPREGSKVTGRRLGADARTTKKWSEAVWFDSLCNRMGSQCGVVFMEANQVLGATKLWAAFTRMRIRRMMRALMVWKRVLSTPQQRVEEEALTFALESIASLQTEVRGLKGKVSELRSTNWSLKRRLLSMESPTPLIQDLPAAASHSLPSPPEDGPEEANPQPPPDDSSSMKLENAPSSKDGREEQFWASPDPAPGLGRSGGSSSGRAPTVESPSAAAAVDLEEDEEFPQAPPVPMRQTRGSQSPASRINGTVHESNGLDTTPAAPSLPRVAARKAAPKQGVTGMIPC